MIHDIEIDIDFLKECAAIASNCTVKQMNNRSRVREAVLGRNLCTRYFRDNTDLSLNKISQKTFGQNHDTLTHAFRKMDDYQKYNDSIFMNAKREFESMIEMGELQIVYEAKLNCIIDVLSKREASFKDLKLINKVLAILK